MKLIQQALRPTRMALIVAAAGLLPFAAQAQGTSMADMQARYQADMQRCATLADAESQRTCRQEAGAAIQEARRGRLVTNQSNTSANAAARCARLPTAQRSDCERLMSDGSTVEHGSVSGGGVLRELSITVPVEPSAPHSYGTQPAPGYGAPAAPAPVYGAQPAPGSYGTQPLPSQGHHHGSMPAR